MQLSAKNQRFKTKKNEEKRYDRNTVVEISIGILSALLNLHCRYNIHNIFTTAYVMGDARPCHNACAVQ